MSTSPGLRLTATLLMALGSACSDSPGPALPEAQLRITLSRIGTGSDADGVLVQVTNAASSTVQTAQAALGDTVRFDGLGAGDYDITLSGLASQCRADKTNIAVTLGGEVTDARFGVDCVGQFAYGRWFSSTRADVVYFDEHGLDHTLFQGGFDIVRDWSPDGRSLLVERWVDARCETYRVELDGTVRQLLVGTASVANARWSPGGDLIAAQVGPCSGIILEPIRVVLLDASSLVPVDTIPTVGIDAHPVWAPDGSQVAFVHDHGALYAYTPGARQLTPVASFTRAVDFPLWSPSGLHIAVLAFDPQQLIVVARADGAVTGVTPDTVVAVGGAAAWFPDGRRLGFIGLGNGSHGSTENLYTFDVNDQQIRQFSQELGNASAFTVGAAPIPQVLVVYRPTGRNELAVANADGTGVRHVKQDAQELVWPLWRTGAVATGSGHSVRIVGRRAIRKGIDSTRV